MNEPLPRLVRREQLAKAWRLHLARRRRQFGPEGTVTVREVDGVSGQRYRDLHRVRFSPRYWAQVCPRFGLIWFVVR